MARSSRTFSEFFLPLSAQKPRSGRRVPADHNAAIQAIWDVVCAIPRGQAATYGAVARAAGLPGRARLTGFALRTAPKTVSLPWHRVVGAGGRIVFPKTSVHYREQAQRLRAEGVAVKDGRVSRTFITDLEEV
jgi:methylated-DNA-protein-cysteine methyltransferase-like protein